MVWVVRAHVPLSDLEPTLKGILLLIPGNEDLCLNADGELGCTAAYESLAHIHLYQDPRRPMDRYSTLVSIMAPFLSATRE